MGHHRRQHHAQTDVEHTGRHLDLALFLAPDQLLHGRAATATQHLGPGDGTKAACSLLALPDAGSLHALLGRHVAAKVVICTGLGFGIDLQPGAAFGAKGGFFGCVFKVHGLAVTLCHALSHLLLRRFIHALLQLGSHLLTPGVNIAQLHGLLARTAVEKVAVQLPCVAHAAMGVQVFLRRIRQRLCRAHARSRSGGRQLWRTSGLRHICRQRPSAVIAVGTRQLIVGVEVGQLVLDALVGANGTAKGLAFLGIGGGHLQRCIGRTQLLKRQHDGGAIAHAGQHLSGAGRSIQQLGSRAAKAQRCIRFGRVECLERLALHRGIKFEDHQHISASRITRQCHAPLRRHAIGHQQAFALQRLAIKHGQIGQWLLTIGGCDQTANASTRNRLQPFLALR